jgi:hypothetical protein
MASVQFSVDPSADDGFYVTVGTELTVYESYEAAIAEVDEKIATETDSFLAEVTIDNDSSDDVEISLEQVGWQRIIRDMTADEDTKAEESAP